MILMDKRAKNQLFLKQKFCAMIQKEQEWHAHSLHMICVFLLVFGEMISMHITGMSALCTHTCQFYGHVLYIY